MQNHVVIVGWDDFSRGVARQLRAANNEVAVVTSDREDLDEIHEALGGEGVETCVTPMADFEVLSEVDIASSRKVFVNLESDEDNLIAILHMKELYGDLAFDVVLENRDLEDTFYVAGVTYAVSKERIASRVVASHMFEPEVGRFNRALIDVSSEETDCDMAQFYVTEDSEFAGATWGDVLRTLRSDYRCLPVGLSHPGKEGERELEKVPAPETAVEPGMYVLVIMQRASLEELEERFGVTEGITH